MKIITTLLITLFTSLIAVDRAFAEDVVAAGSFVGASDHVTRGTATIEKSASGEYFVILGKDFSLDGAPDPKVGLGNDGYQKSAQLGELTSNWGRQVYPIPAHLNPEDFNEIWIWCERFSVPLGVAKIG